MSDQTDLTNFSDDKKAWPVYITLGNLPSGQHNGPLSIAILLLPLLLIPPKLSKSSKADQHQTQINTDILRDVFELIFAPLQDRKQNGIPIDSADKKVQWCFAILAAWISDYK